MRFGDRGSTPLASTPSYICIPPQSVKKNFSPHWKKRSDEHDYPAASNYLSLFLEVGQSQELADRFKKSRLCTYLAKDLLRASRLPLLPRDNFHVKKDLKKVKQGGLLSPVLLVRGNLDTDRPLVIADGYHRVCASYYLDENAEVPCNIIPL